MFNDFYLYLLFPFRMEFLVYGFYKTFTIYKFSGHWLDLVRWYFLQWCIMIEKIERATYHILFLTLILLPMFVMIFDTIFYI